MKGAKKVAFDLKIREKVPEKPKETSGGTGDIEGYTPKEVGSIVGVVGDELKEDGDDEDYKRILA